MNVIMISSTLLILFLFTLVLSKINYNLKGLESVLALIPGISISMHAPWNNHISLKIYTILIIILIYYYLLVTIKRKQAISPKLLLVYFIFTIVETIILNQVDFVGFEGIGAGIVILLLNIGMMLYIFILNLIIYIINRKTAH